MKLDRIIRKNIAALAPYSTARDEYKGEIGIYIDANENPYPTGYNRYPDPHQSTLKKVISEIKNIPTKNIFLGNGSDEAIDLLFRVFCEPKEDEAIVITPSYGMYSVCANINNVKLISVQLDNDYFLEADAILKNVTPSTKLIFLCSPNNPSGNLLNKDEIIKIITNFEGIVAIDEAYIDFAEDEGFVPLLNTYDNIVVLQTLSKAWGMAGLRLGMAFASEEIIDVMTKVKYPYNINCAGQHLVLEELTINKAKKEAELKEIISEREILKVELSKIKYIEKVYPSDANFILIKVPEATKLYNFLISKTVIVRNRSRITGCADTLRLTVGTPEENITLLNLLRTDEEGTFYR